MNIEVQDLGKKFNRNWVFRHLHFTISSGGRFALTGRNGSGKSTLLQLLSGYSTPSEGKILYDGKPFDMDQNDCVLIGPYTELIEEFTLHEFLTFHGRFKKPILTNEQMATRASLPLDKPISDFSTGMKQRTKLITAFFFESSLIFMDEPTANLDEEGTQWWKQEINSLKNKTLILASNLRHEVELCNNYVDL